MTRGRGILAPLVVALLLVCGTTAHAQEEPDSETTAAAETRAGQAEAERRAKAGALEPYRPTPAQAAFLYIEDTRLLGRLFNPTAGWFGQFGGLTEGAGIAGGAGYRIATPQRSAVDLRGLVSMRGGFLAGASWHSDTRAIRPVGLNAHAAVERHAGQRFYGLGPDSTERFDSDYSFDERRIGVDVDLRPSRRVTAVVGGGFSRLELHEVDFDFDDEDDQLETALGGNDPQVRQFLKGRVPGLDTRPQLASLRAAVVVDTRRSYQPGGWRLAAGHSRHHDTSDSQHSFSATQFEVQRFIALWSNTRTLALSAGGERVDAASGHTVPFYLQPSLGGSRRLRGYERQRFRDTSAVILQAEYCYDVNAFVTGALFAEAGQVAPRWSDMRGGGFRGDYGLALRFGYGRNVFLRTELALGGEGPRFVFGLSGVFQ